MAGLVAHGDLLRARGDALADTRSHRRLADRVAAASETAHPQAGEWPSEIHHAFVTRLLQRSRALGTIASTLHHQLENALAARGETIEDAIRAEGQHEAAQQASVANLITSLRLIATFDWSEFFESVSLVDGVLRADSDFAAMDFLSRDTYRHAIEDLARGSGRPELDVTREALRRR